MFSKFDEEAQKVMVEAKREMQALKHPYVGSEHLMLAILKGNNDVSKKLKTFGIDYKKFKNEIINIIGEGSTESDWFLYTPLLKRTLESAVNDAKEVDGVVTISNLFYSILEEGEGVAIRIMLGMNVDTYTIEKLFLQLDPNFEGLRDLKEEYIQFNHTEYDNEFDVLLDLNALIDKYDKSDQSIFRDFAGFLRRNLRPIVNSFTRIKVYRKSARTEKEYYARLSNGPMESFNRKPKDLKRDSRGFSDFNYTRIRILWATRKNPSIKGVPKSMDQILSKKGKKRGSYKKKNQKVSAK